MSTLAVVIPTRNMAHHLGRALGSACHGGADEIVVIDDASEDDTAVVVEHWQSQFSHVQYVRHAQKLEDHNLAQRDIWMALKSDQILGMGADDYLYPGAIAALKSCVQSPVVFGDADAIDEAGQYLYPHLSDFYGVRSPHEVQQRFQSCSNVIESGCGSALRADMARWLWQHQWHDMGPMMDSVGYATVACLHGAAYLKRKTVAIMVTQSSYGHSSQWSQEQLLQLAKVSIGFMRYVGLDEPTVRGISEKRCYVQWSDT
jgi:glycosyltransferase involved in cell wall biosynthesis